MESSFQDALDMLTDAATPSSAFGWQFLNLLPVNGAAVSTLGEILGTETVSATDHQSARLDELQFDLGEGPCWEALHLMRPVLEPSLRAVDRWPRFVEAIDRDAISSIFAFPVTLGPLRLGAVDLYSTHPTELNTDQTRKATALAEVIGKRLLRDALTGAESHDETSAHSRRTIHQATGVVLAQLSLTPEDAELMIQGHAFATNRSMMDVAGDIVAGTIIFVRGADGGIGLSS